MMKRIIAAALFALAAVNPALAQFADQATFGTGGGAANAQQVTINNVTSLADLQGVLFKYVPTATNTGAATLQVVSNSGSIGSATAIRKLTGAGLAALTGGEVVSALPVVMMYDGTYFDIMSPTSDTIGARMLGNSALGSSPVNLQLSAAAGSNNLVLSILTAAGGTPSSSTPVLIPFRDTTLGNGDPVVVSVQAATTFTITATNTMGCTSAVLCRLWLVAFNNAGTAVLCAINANASGTSITTINENVLQTSQSGTSGGSTAQLYYCGASALSSKAVRILGYVEATETTGNWGSVTAIQLFGPGIKRPGDVVQVVTSTSTTTSTTTNTSTVAALSPAVTLSITPSAIPNLVRATMYGTMQAGVAVGQISLARTTTPIGVLNELSSGTIAPVMLFVLDAPATTSSTAYNLYGRSNSAATLTWAPSTITTGWWFQLEEIMGALDEPANDNGEPLGMVG